MTGDAPSSTSVRPLTWIALALAVGLIALGVYWYGFSMDVHRRFWRDIFDRVGGPMTFRFLLQPTMAGIAALHDGIKDARQGHKSFFWTARRDPTQQGGRLREGLDSTARIMLLGIGMDLIYQMRVFERFYPAEAVMIALLLAVVPYFILRWIVEHIARRRLAGAKPGDPQ